MPAMRLVQGLHSGHDGQTAHPAYYALLPFAKVFQAHVNLPVLYQQITLGQQLQRRGSQLSVMQSLDLRGLKAQVKHMVRQAGLPGLVAEV